MRRKRKSNTAGRKRKGTSPISIPKGLRKGDRFARGGVSYRVVSYVTQDGKRIRYARRI
jgi:hypothetical protein